MNRRILYYWNEARSNYWFIPSLMVLAAIGLSFITLNFDRNAHASAERLRFFWGGGPDGARGMLEVIAGSMMTVATLTFSITTVTFSQASAQFGPRLLRNFIRDTGNQVVLGTFVSTFVYCLLVLRAIRSAVEAAPGSLGQSEFVPEFSISVGIIMALASLGVLIYFIHHVSQSIYAPNVIANVAEDMIQAINRLFPKEDDPYPSLQSLETPPELPEEFEDKAVRVDAPKSGYLQALDYGHLLSLANQHNLILQVHHRPGHFAIYGDDLALVWPAERIDKALLRSLTDAFTIGRVRVAPQDVEFAMDQLVEVAVRALSPAINDPFTAMNCIDWLGVGLSRLAEKKIPPPYMAGADGSIRIFLKHPVTFQRLADTAFNQIRQYAVNTASLQLRLLEVIAVIAEHTDDPRELAALDRHAKIIQRMSHKHLEERDDISDVDERYQKVEEAESD